MTSQEKKQYLLKYRYFVQEVERLSDERAQVIAKAGKITPDLSDMPKSQSGANRLELAVERIVENADKLEEKIKEMLQAKEEIEQVIDSLEDDTLRQLMKYRYINLMKWEEIAVQMFYGYQWVCKLHGRALAKIQINRR